MIADYAEIVKEAGKLYSPACVANYIYDLVKEYNQSITILHPRRRESGIEELPF